MSLESLRFKLSENHSPARREMRVDLPMPWGPFKTSMVSNFTPGSCTRRTAAQRVFLVTART